MFMRLNAGCAHQARPPRSGVGGLGDLCSDNLSPLRITVRRGVTAAGPPCTTGVQSLASRAGSNRGRATTILCGLEQFWTDYLAPAVELETPTTVPTIVG
jgi:hypothetical protein